MSHNPGDHKFPGTVDYFSRDGDFESFCLARRSNLVAADEDGHVWLWLADAWIDDGDMRERKVAELRETDARRGCSSIPHANRPQSRFANLIPVPLCGKQRYTATSASSC